MHNRFAEMHKYRMLDWNDLQYFLAVAREGSTTAAAKALGVNQSTVQRRLAELEKALGRPLVVRRTTGYELTPLARSLLPLAEQVRTSVDVFEQRVREISKDGREVIRLTCPEPVVNRLRPLVERFSEKYPQYSVEFVTSDRYLDLLKGDADVAFRSGDTVDALVGHAVATSTWGVYASADYLAKQGRPADYAGLNDHQVLSLDNMPNHRLVQWLREVAPRAEIVSRSNSMLGLIESVRAGLGIAPLPVALATQAGLTEVFGAVPALSRTWKVLTHPELRETPRIAAFFEFVSAEKEAFRTVLG